jgi:tetratricopeptide (TPR) repeat protein
MLVSMLYKSSRLASLVPKMSGLLILFAYLISGEAQSTTVQGPQDIQTLVSARQFSQAEQAVQDRLQRSPDWDLGHLLLAQIYNSTGRYDLAERSARSAVRLRESLDGFLLLAVATMHSGQLNQSIGWLEKAAQRQADHPEIYKLLGLDYALGGMLRESEQAFRRSVELQPGNWELYYLQGRALYELGQLRETERILRQAIKLNPSSVKSWTALGQVQEKLYDSGSAEESYQKAVGLCGPQTSECAWPLLQLGYLTERQQGPQAAESYLRQAVAARPDWAKPHFYLGKTLAALGNLNAARTEMEAAVRLDEAKSQYHYQLALLYRQLKEPQRAKQHLERYRALVELERDKRAPAEFGSP